jgi:hypothetical protein
MWFPPPSLKGGLGAEFEGGRGSMAITAPCVLNCLISQGTVAGSGVGRMLKETSKGYSLSRFGREDCSPLHGPGCYIGLSFGEGAGMYAFAKDKG